MGQSTSRLRDSTISAPPAQCPPSSNRRFRRGRKLLNLVKSSSRSTNAENTRRRSLFGWPSRPTSTIVPTTPTTAASQDGCSSQSPASSAPSTPSIVTPRTTPQSYRPIDKGSVVEVPSLDGPSGVEVLSQAPSLSRRPSELGPSPSAGPCPPEDSSSTIISPVQEAIPPAPLSSQSSSPIENASAHPSPSSPSTTSHTHQTQNIQTTPPARQFPPPGTLVLVQGVVQTTDVPRPPNADNVTEMNNARPRSPSESANRSYMPSSDSRPSSSLPSEIIEHAEHDSASHEGSADPSTPTHVHEQPSTSAPDSQARSSPATPPNGVEVLGTLLSVAAAATAASLLAGSAETILSPTRTNSTPSLSGEVPDLSLSARRERMRHAWQSVRERLGLRPSAPSTTVPADGQQVDAREVMLAEMARAFNLGLGISPDSEEANATAQPVVETEPSRPLSPPAPGSFEQFLADLQNDLRGVLSEAEGPATPQVEEEEAETPAETSSTAPEPTVEEPSSAESLPENGQESGSRNVNWWRMYRFPQMSARNGVPTLPSSPLETTTEPRTPSPTSPTTDASVPSGNVVPVVVVGLRSVNVPGQFPTPEVPTPAPSPSPTEAEPMPGSWPSRAASAIRNLRPGRRNEQQEEAPASTGSPRTFLIFVIGGYYPPDHSMVTGGENSLASFEALLELAEMFGQNKPQTASKDDIERSGLQIIPARDIPKYEQEGKISSNCTDSCLICLDDYEPEDPVRIMTCRHGFHKTCVDRWLETGRNNCPACRSAGVSTDISAM